MQRGSRRERASHARCGRAFTPAQGRRAPPRRRGGTSRPGRAVDRAKGGSWGGKAGARDREASPRGAARGRSRGCFTPSRRPQMKTTFPFVHRSFLASGLLGALALAGCAHTPALSPAGSLVAISRQPPAPGCRAIGFLVGEGGGSGIVGGRWVPNDKLVAYAASDLRNKASALGSNYIQIDPPELGSSGGTTSTVTISGTAYRCAEVRLRASGFRRVGVASTASTASTGRRGPAPRRTARARGPRARARH